MSVVTETTKTHTSVQTRQERRYTSGRKRGPGNSTATKIAGMWKDNITQAKKFAGPDGPIGAIKKNANETVSMRIPATTAAARERIVMVSL